MAGTRRFWPRRANPAGQALFFEAQPNLIARGVHQISQSVRHSEDEEDRGVDAHRHAGVTLFDPGQRVAADESAFGHERHGQAPPSAGGRDVLAELFQRSPHTSWQGLLGT